MADIYSIPLVGSPEDSGEAWYEPALLSLQTNKLEGAHQQVLVLKDPSQDIGISGYHHLPDVGTITSATLRAWVYSTVIANDFSLAFKYVFMADSEDGDVAAWDESVVQTETVDGASEDWNYVTKALTSGNFKVNEIMLWFFGRDTTDDTLVGSIYVADAAIVLA